MKFRMLVPFLMSIAVCPDLDAAQRRRPPAPAVEKDDRPFVVKEAGRVAVRSDGELVDYRLAGVWTPTPPGITGQDEHYMGAAAREFVDSILAAAPPAIRIVGTPVGSGLRVEVGREREDLAVLLARLGLAMCDRASASDRDHAEAVCDGERHARRERLGMHDGGFQEFVNRKSSVVDLGLLLWWEGERRGPQQDYRFDGGSSGSRRSGRASESWSARAPMRDAISAIRDYGASMGLPRDSSSAGR